MTKDEIVKKTDELIKLCDFHGFMLIGTLKENDPINDMMEHLIYMNVSHQNLVSICITLLQYPEFKQALRDAAIQTHTENVNAIKH